MVSNVQKADKTTTLLSKYFNTHKNMKKGNMAIENQMRANATGI